MPDTKDNNIKLKRLVNDEDFYNNVFKKTEKIISVIFYILSETKITETTQVHIETIKDKALKTHELSLETLNLQTHEQHRGLLRLQSALLGLESTLRIAGAVRVIPPEVFDLLVDQLDAVMRYINNHYLKNEGLSANELTEVLVKKETVRSTASRPARSAATTSRQRRVNIPAGDISSDAYLVYSQLTDRAERIKTVLEAKPNATVKDIAEVITDVSEKTIQRELNSLIEKGQVVREGERRWSRYSVVK